MLAALEIREGQKVLLRQKAEEGAETKPYEFTVEAVSPDEILLFPVDRRLDISSVFTPGEIVIGTVPDDPPVQFQAVVIRARRIPMPMLVLSAPEQVAVVERRRYFRIRVLFDVKVAFLLEGGKISEFFEGTGVDISSMGLGVHLKFSVSRSIPHPNLHQQVLVLGSLPPVRYEFPTGLSFEAKGEIRNITEIPTGWRIGIMFTEIERRTQDLIVAWCFAFQRRLKREGLSLLNGEVVADETEVKGAWQR